jgi:DNA-binding response OmpR family regulator
MDGLEVLECSRAADPQPPVLLLTGKDAPDDHAQGFERGADNYVVRECTRFL